MPQPPNLAHGSKTEIPADACQELLSHNILCDRQRRRPCSIMMWGRELSGRRRPGTSHLRVFHSGPPPARSC